MKIEDAEKFVIIKMFDERAIGNHQIRLESICHGTPRSDWGIIQKAIKNLAKKTFFGGKAKHYGSQISLDSAKLTEIKEYLRQLGGI